MSDTKNYGEPTEWIDWSGGGFGSKPEEIQSFPYQVKFRDGSTDDIFDPGTVSYTWMHLGHDYDIVAYRLYGTKQKATNQQPHDEPSGCHWVVWDGDRLAPDIPVHAHVLAEYQSVGDHNTKRHVFAEARKHDWTGRECSEQHGYRLVKYIILPGPNKV